MQTRSPSVQADDDARTADANSDTVATIIDNRIKARVSITGVNFDLLFHEGLSGFAPVNSIAGIGISTKYVLIALARHAGFGMPLTI